ncbi:MAG TPA: nucleoside 2-deoxyribosyltransferase, partial [Candidatus Magasanikbacteria bacterium]|nr:nucleoside 2-deoxyribosyltransferase [Candidatus Magasanikbacteria bacterium]
MNIFFTAAIRGGREHQRNYQTIVSLLKTHGTVFSDHVANDMPRHGETAISVEEVHARELERMEKSDVIVADVTTPSLGVGYLVGQASRL